MNKKRPFVVDWFRRTLRKIRFLARRGTLFHKTPRHIRAARKKNNWLTYRKIRFLLKKGSLFKFKPSASPTNGASQTENELKPIYTLISEVPNKTQRISFHQKVYKSYRQVRFLVSTGRLFKRKKKKRKSRKNRFLQRIRVIRYLARKGTLFKFEKGAFRNYFATKMGFLFTSTYLKIVLNSTFIFILAYLVEFLFFYFASGIAALTFSMNSVIYHYDIHYLVRGAEWTFDSVKIVYSAGPFVSLVVCFLSLIAYSNFIQETWISRLFILWLFCHSFIHFFGEVFAGCLFSQGFGYVIMYLFFMDTAKVVISLLMLMIFIFSGLIFARFFLFSGNIYFNYLTGINRMPFTISQFLIPFLLGNLILVLIKIPNITVLEISVNVSMILLLLPVILRAGNIQDIFFDDMSRKIRINWKWIATSLLLLILFRVVFGFGIRLG